MKPFIVVSALFLFIQIAGVSLTETPARGAATEGGAANPLQKVQLEIEGIHKKSSLRKVELALLSLPGVKTVEFRVKKKWFFFKNYNEIDTIVEFELGTLTSETLIRAVESASDAKHIYKVKFVE